MTTKLPIENYGEEFTTIINSMPSAVATLAGQWYDGQFSALYALSSTGRIIPGSLARISDRTDALQWVCDHYGQLAREWRDVEKSAGGLDLANDAALAGLAFLVCADIQDWANGELNPDEYTDNDRIDYESVKSGIQNLANTAEAVEFESDFDESDDE